MKTKRSILAVCIALFLCMAAAVPVFAADSLPRVVDEADLLTDNEERQLLTLLDEISERQQADVVVVTVDSLDGESAQDYADDFYDYNGYGYGGNYDGVLLLVSMEGRDWCISTCGYGITAITDAGVKYLSDKFSPELSDGNYAQAFTIYAELCDEFFTQAAKGQPFDVGQLPKEPFSIVRNLFITLAIGFVVAFVATTIMKGKLETVRFQSAAGSYVKQNSLKVTESRDMYLYTHVTRQERPKENRSSGGSSTHTSSSGRTHGGGSGKF